MATNASVSEMEKERELFLDVFPSIMDTLVTKTKFSHVPHVANWTKKVLFLYKNKFSTHSYIIP